MIRRPLFLLVLAACGGDDGGTPVDTPQVQSTIVPVDPCTGESATVMAGNALSGPYMPMMTTINQGQIVKFVMPGLHNVAPKTASDDPGLSVGFGATKCLRFTSPGTFNFKCEPHGFTGSVVVQ